MNWNAAKRDSIPFHLRFFACGGGRGSVKIGGHGVRGLRVQWRRRWPYGGDVLADVNVLAAAEWSRSGLGTERVINKKEKERSPWPRPGPAQWARYHSQPGRYGVGGGPRRELLQPTSHPDGPARTRCRPVPTNPPPSPLGVTVSQSVSHGSPDQTKPRPAPANLKPKTNQPRIHGRGRARGHGVPARAEAGDHGGRRGSRLRRRRRRRLPLPPQ